MKLKCLLVSLIVAAWILPTTACQAQKLKLPNLLPFKKKTDQVQPIQLSDHAQKGAQRQSRNEKGVFDFLKPKTSSRPSATADFRQKPKGFFAKTGDEIEGFAAGTKKFFSDAWNPPRAKKAWWNKEAQTNQVTKQSIFPWSGSKSGDQMQPPPMPRTARQYQPGQPRHRFK